MSRPVLKEGKCCYHCKYFVSYTDRSGDYIAYCSKYADGVSDTSLCVDFERVI